MTNNYSDIVVGGFQPASLADLFATLFRQIDGGALFVRLQPFAEKAFKLTEEWTGDEGEVDVTIEVFYDLWTEARRRNLTVEFFTPNVK